MKLAAILFTVTVGLGLFTSTVDAKPPHGHSACVRFYVTHTLEEGTPPGFKLRWHPC